jgi:single-stranded-DNA-specific exonuclease
MEDAALALELLLAPDLETALPLAERLQQQNTDRQRSTMEIVSQARERVRDLEDGAPALVLGDESWSLGVLGLAASKLVEEFYRPAFVFNLQGGECRGSARSIEGFHLVDCLNRCAPLLIRYGGHAMAAGLTVARERFLQLRERLFADAAARLHAELLSQTIQVEAVASLNDCKPSLHQEVQMLAPFGVGNPEPVFLTREAEVLSAEAFGKDSRHLRLRLRDGTATAEAMAFDKAQAVPHLTRGRRIDLLYTVDCRRWEGLDRIQLRLRDLRPAARPVVRLSA